MHEHNTINSTQKYLSLRLTNTKNMDYCYYLRMFIRDKNVSMYTNLHP